jgi:hypothetical protein
VSYASSPYATCLLSYAVSKPIPLVPDAASPSAVSAPKTLSVVPNRRNCRDESAAGAIVVIGTLPKHASVCLCFGCACAKVLGRAQRHFGCLARAVRDVVTCATV